MENRRQGLPPVRKVTPEGEAATSGRLALASLKVPALHSSGATVPTLSERIPLIAGNWKMNLDHQKAAEVLQQLLAVFDDSRHDRMPVEVAVFPPFTALPATELAVGDSTVPLAYGGQDLSPYDSGAYTGDISGQFLAALGCRYVLVGHSERRSVHGETDDVLNAKVIAALRHEVVPVLCVGETLEVRQAGKHFEHTLNQLRAGVKGLTSHEAGQLVIAYEPIWAIGTGAVAGPEDAQEMCKALRTEFGRLFGPEQGQQVRFLYGGSVKASNASFILNQPDVDGVLVGGASLDPVEFARIAGFAVGPR